MSTFVTFRGYGVGSSEKTVDALRVTDFELIDYNNNHGTCLHLDTGREINVGEWPDDVRKKLEAARPQL
jgi:hypothetical protein